jgi:hypothetical protein
MAPPYLYQPLPSPDSMRLIWLFDGADTDPLRCYLAIMDNRPIAQLVASPNTEIRYPPEDIDVSTVATAPLESDPEHRPVIHFDALSYTWGNPYCALDSKHNGLQDWGATLQLTVEYVQDGVKHETSLQIAPNLDGALRRIRRYYREEKQRNRFVWVDAVCINQEDIPERNAQVKLMGRVYGHAKNVIVWLGPENEETAAGIAIMELLFTNGKFAFSNIANEDEQMMVETAMEQHRQVERIAREQHSVLESKSYGNLGIPVISLEEWAAVYSVLTRRWFNRMWIVQEVALGGVYPRIFCGDFQIVWPLISRTVNVLADTGWMVELSLPSLLDGTQQWPLFRALEPLSARSIVDIIRTESDNDMVKLLHKTTEFQCFDPRDKIYALLSLTPNVANAIVPDYNKSVAMVYTEAVKVVMKASSDLYLLGWATKAFRTIDSEKMPSWVPDFNNNIWRSILSTPKLPFSSAGFENAANIHPSGFGQLCVDGYIFDVVESAGGSYYDALNGGVMEWLAILEDLPLNYVTGELLADVFWRTMLLFSEVGTKYPVAEQTRNEFRVWFTDVLARALLSNINQNCRVNGGWLSIKADNTEGMKYLQSQREALISNINRLHKKGGAFPSAKEVQKMAELFMSVLQPHCAQPRRSLKFLFKTKENPPRTLLRTHGGPCSSQQSKNFENFLGTRNNLSRLYRTSRNYLGAAPSPALSTEYGGPSQIIDGKHESLVGVGDEVWILPGMNTPVLLRPKTDGAYLYLGVTYVHGIMLGEAMDGRLTRTQIVIE